MHFNQEPADVFSIIEEIDTEMSDFDLESRGWSNFYVCRRELDEPIDGFTKEWVFISFNSEN